MYPKAKYINIFESKFVRPNKTGRAGATYATNSDIMITIRLDSIVSIHTELIEYSHLFGPPSGLFLSHSSPLK